MSQPKAFDISPRQIGILRTIANVTVVLLFLLLVVGSCQRFMATGSVNSFGLVIVNALIVFLFVTRRKSKATSTAPGLWVLSFTGTALPLLLRPGEEMAHASVGSIVQVLGLILMIAALLSLQRSFGIVPANRGIREGGLYRIVRHPLYAAELLVFLGVVLVTPTPWNILIWTIECGVQLCRARAEERFLIGDPVYRVYRERVRYQLMPGLI